MQVKLIKNRPLILTLVLFSIENFDLSFAHLSRGYDSYIIYLTW